MGASSRFLLGTLALAATMAASAQTQVSASNKWWAYLADYDGTPGSTRVDMGQHANAPIADLPLLVIAGTKYTTSLASGFPEERELQRLNDLSDKLILAIMALGPSVYVGTFTQNREQVHYVYVKDLAGIEEAFAKTLKRECGTCAVLYRTKRDPEWNTYLKFLYPNQATMDFYRFDPKQVHGHRE